MKQIQLLEKLFALRADGYSKICLTELSHTLQIPVNDLKAMLHSAGFRLIKRRGMFYIDLAEMPKPKVSFSDPALPKSQILREVS